MPGQGFVCPIQRARSSVFFALARCLNVLFDAEILVTHSCANQEKCCNTLLVDVFQHMKGVGDPDINNRVMNWIKNAKDFNDPSELLRLLFEESQKCDKEFFTPFIIQMSKRSNCKCEDMIGPSWCRTMCIMLRVNQNTMHDALIRYFHSKEMCNFCSAEKTEIRKWCIYPSIICIRIHCRRERNEAVYGAIELKVKDVIYKFRSALVIEDGEFHSYFMEGNGLYTWRDGKHEARDLALIGNPCMVFFEKCTKPTVQHEQDLVMTRTSRNRRKSKPKSSSPGRLPVSKRLRGEDE